MMVARANRHVSAIAALLALSLVWGCGGGDDGSDGADSTATDAAIDGQSDAGVDAGAQDDAPIGPDAVVKPAPKPPTVKIVNPGDGAVLHGKVTLEAIAEAARKHIKVVQIRFDLDGKPIAQLDKAPWSAQWDTGNAAEGKHKLTATALDSAGSSALPNVSPLALQDVAVADGVVLIAAQSTGVGSGKLVVYDVDSTNSDDKSFAGCTTPVGVAARPGTSWVALACAEPAGLGVVGYDLAANQWGAWADLGSGAFAGVALDAVGDVALVLDSSAGGTLSATVLEDGRALAAWDLLDGVSGNVGIATVDDAHTLMGGGPAGSVTAVGPYATGAPCSGVAP